MPIRVPRRRARRPATPESQRAAGGARPKRSRVVEATGDSRRRDLWQYPGDHQGLGLDAIAASSPDAIRNAAARTCGASRCAARPTTRDISVLPQTRSSRRKPVPGPRARRAPRSNPTGSRYALARPGWRALATGSQRNEIRRIEGGGTVKRRDDAPISHRSARFRKLARPTLVHPRMTASRRLVTAVSAPEAAPEPRWPTRGPRGRRGRGRRPVAPSPRSPRPACRQSTRFAEPCARGAEAAPSPRTAEAAGRGSAEGAVTTSWRAVGHRGGGGGRQNRLEQAFAESHMAAAELVSAARTRRPPTGGRATPPRMPREVGRSILRRPQRGHAWQQPHDHGATCLHAGSAPERNRGAKNSSPARDDRRMEGDRDRARGRRRSDDIHGATTSFGTELWNEGRGRRAKISGVAAAPVKRGAVHDPVADKMKRIAEEEGRWRCLPPSSPTARGRRPGGETPIEGRGTPSSPQRRWSTEELGHRARARAGESIAQRGRPAARTRRFAALPIET